MWRRRSSIAGLLCGSLTIDGLDVAEDSDRGIEPTEEHAWTWRYRHGRRSRRL